MNTERSEAQEREKQLQKEEARKAEAERMALVERMRVRERLAATKPEEPRKCGSNIARTVPPHDEQTVGGGPNENSIIVVRTDSDTESDGEHHLYRAADGFLGTKSEVIEYERSLNPTLGLNGLQEVGPGAVPGATAEESKEDADPHDGIVNLLSVTILDMDDFSESIFENDKRYLVAPFGVLVINPLSFMSW